MELNNIILNSLLLFALFSFFINFFILKLSRGQNSILLDQDFLKPQAYHEKAVPRSGGLAAIISLSVFFLIYYFLFKEFLFDYFLASILLFILGFLDDIKLNISPNIRLFLMIIFLLFITNFFSINLISVDLIFLNNWLSNNIFNNIFIILCFLFIINGSNLIDGFNGLLSIHLIIINLILLFIHLHSGNNEYLLIISAQILVLLTFLFFNFPKAQMFLGDGGSYLFGTLTVLNIIKTNNLNPEISSFFFCVLLFYLFFEVFFSFFRKSYSKKSPLRPDKNHLHMLVYRYLVGLRKFKDCNFLTSLVINTVYSLIMMPAFYYKNSGLFCKYWFMLLIVAYLIFYSRIYSFAKK